MYSMNIFGSQLDTVFGLYLESYIIPSPEVKTDYRFVPGRHGSIDKTDKFGTVFFEDRKWEDVILKKTGENIDEDSKVALEKDLLNLIHGKKGNISFDDDTNYHWVGRVFVEDVHVENNGLIVVTLNLVTDPFKYGNVGKTYSLSLTSNQQSVSLQNGRKVIIPTLIVSDSATVSFTVNGNSYQRVLSQGTWRITDLLLYEGTTVLNATGSGTLVIQYEDAQL